MACKRPQEVIDATAEYRDEMDPVGAFVGMCIETVPSNPDGSSSTSFVSARQMYDAFVAWAIGNAVRPWREKKLLHRDVAKGFCQRAAQIRRALSQCVAQERPRYAAAPCRCGGRCGR